MAKCQDFAGMKSLCLGVTRDCVAHHITIENPFHERKKRTRQDLLDVWGFNCANTGP
jgi:hypothetical protein